MASIIIPAHNEAAVIDTTLAKILREMDIDRFEVIVVCNGCSDDTASIARKCGDPVSVIEIDRASKTDALNAGDAAANGYPRIYLDADIDISSQSITQLVDYLEEPESLAAEPSCRIDTSRSNWLVKAYYAVWVALHGQKPGDIGGGVYAMSLEGRRRFGEFPSIIGDDAYAKAHFNEDELRRVEGATSVVHAPQRVHDLLQIKTRSRIGVIELQDKHPNLWQEKRTNTTSLPMKAAALPLRVWPAVPIYVVLQSITKWRARRFDSASQAYHWQRDDSSRGGRR